MDNDIFNSYLIAIKSIRSRESLEMINIVSFPNLKSEQQKKIHKDLHKKYQSIFEASNTSPVSIDALANILGASQVNG